GCDMSQLDDFTLNLLCNDEVIEVNQDPLGKQASPVKNSNGIQIWMRPLEDHSYAVGIFNGGNDDPYDLVSWDSNSSNAKAVKVLFSDLKLKGKFKVRDIWRQKNLEVKGNSIDVKVPHHGVAFLKITPVK
ncbi:MAG: alpha-galactosidase, partial [Bacteroidota bacterium]|nr:alpha-galactosidase [Bacteroidota bacterium]